jgi:hypothetical protein
MNTVKTYTLVDECMGVHIPLAEGITDLKKARKEAKRLDVFARGKVAIFKVKITRVKEKK